MPQQTFGVRDINAAQYQFPAFDQLMAIVALADTEWEQRSHVYSCSGCAIYISAMRISAGKVTFKLRGWPSISSGDRPSISTALASSVIASGSGAADKARNNKAYENICGVCAS